jgi:hypothetical protein
MSTQWNEKLRQLAEQEYVLPARKTHAVVRIQQGDLYDKARKLGLPQSHANQVGTSLESRRFWEPRGLEMITPKGQSRERTTVYEYRFRDKPTNGNSHTLVGHRTDPEAETPSERAFRLTERVRGLLKDEIAAFGGTEAFMRWVRSDEEDAA